MKRYLISPLPRRTHSGVPRRVSTRRFCGLLVVALGLAGCGSGTGGGGKKQFVVAFSQANNAEPYRAAQNAFLARLFAAQPDVKLAIGDAQQDNSRQVAQVETFIRQKPDLLIVAPNERAALTAVMGQAMEAQDRKSTRLNSSH